MNNIGNKIIRCCTRSLLATAASTLLLFPVAAFAATTAPAAPASAKTAAAAIPVEDFFKVQQFSNAKLSPNGKNIAMLTADQSDRSALSVFNIETGKAKLLARYADADVMEFFWVNNNRLVYGIGDRKLAAGDVSSGWGLYAVDIGNGNQRQLIDRQFINEHRVSRVLDPMHAFFSTINEKETNDIYITQYIRSSGGTHPGSTNLLRLDTVNGTTTGIDRPGEVERWVLDQNGLPRVATTYAKGMNTAWVKDDKTNKWIKLYDYDGDDKDAIEPQFFGPDGKFYVAARQGKDTTALYLYDLEKNRISAEPLVALEGYDYNGSVIVNRTSKKILGIHYNTDAPGTLWFDENYQQIQKKVDTLLPGKINRIDIQIESGGENVVVHSISDVDPGSYLLFNTKTASLTLLGQSRPWIKPEQMAYRDFIKYQARDGLTIPAYLTLPKGQKKNLPMVVLVHGGPFVRGEEWHWEALSQFLASRGYAVLQPEFRGSTGYGYKHERLGWKQWGLTMQDDVTDGTKWAIEKGYADPKRVCIAGASYGGYAAIWGLIKEPDLYRCGVSWVGVTDIGYMHTLAQSDFNDDVIDFYLPKKVADLKQDAAQIKATSAVENASKLKAPLILAYGGSDRRVPKEHGEKLKSALNGSNPNLEWIVYPEEGHGWSRLKNNVDFWTRVEKFLARNTWKQEAAKTDTAPVTAK